MTDSTNRLPPGYIVAAWTTLKIPAASTFEDAKTKDGKKWISIIRTLASHKQPGFLQGMWGRVMESREDVWLVTAWSASEALDKFEESAAYATHLLQLLSISASPPTTVRCDFPGLFWTRFTNHTGITDAYFPASISAQERAHITSLRGLVYFMAPGLRKPLAYNGTGMRGWVREIVDRDGQAAVAMRFVDYWVSREKEEEFKADSPVVLPSGEAKSVHDHFVHELGEAGMLGMTERHCRFSYIPWGSWGDAEDEGDGEGED